MILCNTNFVAEVNVELSSEKSLPPGSLILGEEPLHIEADTRNVTLMDTDAGFKSVEVVVDNNQTEDEYDLSDPDLVKAIKIDDSTRYTQQFNFYMKIIKLFFSIYQVRCVLCSFISECKGNTKKHVVKDHRNWKEEISNMNKNKPKQTIHNHQNWRAELIRNFKDLIIGKCSVKVQNAVRSNEDIQVIWSVECCNFEILYHRMVVIMMRSLTKF